MPLLVPVLGVVLFLGAVFFLVLEPPKEPQDPLFVVPVDVSPDSVPDDPITREFDSTTENIIASLISRNHYLQPEYESVISHTSSRDAIQKYLKTLDDYSRILSVEESEFAKTRSLPTRVGPGADYLFDHQDVIVFPVFEGELYSSGMTSAGLLESINDRPLDITDFQSYEFLTSIKDNEAVELMISNPPQSAAELVSIRAKPYDNPAVRFYRERDAVVLEVRHFRSGYTGRVRSAIVAAQSSKRFVIDLRYSPGGDIYAMADWLSLLLPENQLIVQLQTQRYKMPTELRALSGQIPLETPIVILISRFTASSAEIYARVLKSSFGDQVQLVGEATKGKCLAQKQYSVSTDYVLVLSTHEVLMANGKGCNGVKLQADIKRPKIEFEKTSEVLQGLR